MRNTVVAATLGLLILTGCGSSQPTSSPSSPNGTPTSASPTAKSTLTAATVVDKLGDLYPLPNPTDNTSSCAAKSGDSAKGCLTLITTDAVSVYEFEDTATSKRWVDAFKKDGHDWRQAGRFALAWTARDQSFTSKEARTKMTASLRKWAEQES